MHPARADRLFCDAGIRREAGRPDAIKSTARLEPTSISRNYFFKAYGMEALTFEIGDNTSRARIREKGEVGANALTTLMPEKSVPS